MFVCVCVLLGVSLVESRRRHIPRYCRKYITNLQTYAHEPGSTDDDDSDQNDDDDDEVDDDDDSMTVAMEEITMLNLMIDFME